jgi:hypothetical protein
LSLRWFGGSLCGINNAAQMPCGGTIRVMTPKTRAGVGWGTNEMEHRKQFKWNTDA